jgi:hypothetical protein
VALLVALAFRVSPRCTSDVSSARRAEYDGLSCGSDHTHAQWLRQTTCRTRCVRLQARRRHSASRGVGRVLRGNVPGASVDAACNSYRAAPPGFSTAGTGTRLAETHHLKKEREAKLYSRSRFAMIARAGLQGARRHWIAIAIPIAGPAPDRVHDRLSDRRAAAPLHRNQGEPRAQGLQPPASGSSTSTPSASHSISTTSSSPRTRIPTRRSSTSSI